MTRFRYVIEFVLFVASILKMRFTFCPKYSSIRDGFFHKIENKIPNYNHIPISTLIIQLMNSTDYYLNKQLVRYVSFCLKMQRDNLISKVELCYLIYISLLFLLFLKYFCNAVTLFFWPCQKSSLLLLL